MKDKINLKNIYKAIIAIMTLLAVLSLYQGIRNALTLGEGSQDFQWDSVKAMVMGINPYDASLREEDKSILERVIDGYSCEENYKLLEANQFPSLLLILLPFVFLSAYKARVAWLIVNILLTALMIFLLRKTFLKELNTLIFIPLMLLMLMGTPLRNQIGVGQHTIFAFTFFLLAVYISENEGIIKNNVLRTVIVSICLFLCYFKYTLTVPLVLYFIYKKKYGEIIASIIPHIILTFYSAYLLGDSFVNMIFKPLMVSGSLSSEGGIDFGFFLQGSSFTYILTGLLFLFMVYIAVLMPKGREDVVISLLVLGSLIMVYHRTYDFFVLVTAAAVFTDNPYRRYCIDYESKDVKEYAGLILYILSLFMVFFFLRIFSENLFSKMVTALIYYGFTAYIGFVSVNELSYDVKIKKKR